MILALTIGAFLMVADSAPRPSTHSSELVNRILSTKFSSCKRTVSELFAVRIPDLVQLERLKGAPDSAYIKLGAYKVQSLIESATRLVVDPDLRIKHFRLYHKIAIDAQTQVIHHLRATGGQRVLAYDVDPNGLQRQRAAIDQLLSVLEEQSVRPPLELDTALRYRHLDPEYATWIMKFDTMRLDSPEMQRLESSWTKNQMSAELNEIEANETELEWRTLHALVSSPDVKPGSLSAGVDSSLKSKIIHRLSELDIVEQTYQELWIDRNFWNDPLFKKRMATLFQKLELKKHPFMDLVRRTEPTLAKFFDDLNPSIDAYRSKTAAAKKAELQSVKDFGNEVIQLSPTARAEALINFYSEVLSNAEEDRFRDPYVPTGVLAAFSTRFLILRMLEDSNTLVIRPEKRQKDGDFIVATPEYQLKVRLDSNGEIDQLIFLTQTPKDLSYKIPRIKLSPIAAKLPSTEVKATAISPSENESNSSTSPIATSTQHTANAYKALNIPPLGLSRADEALVLTRLESLNREFPGHHEFIEAAASLISPDGDLVKELPWYLGQIRKRLATNGSTTDNDRVDLLLDSIIRTLGRRQQTATLANEPLAKDAVAMNSLSLEPFIDGSRPLSELEAGKIYKTLLASNNSTAQVKFEQDVIDFLQDPNTQARAWLRAIRRGHVAKDGQSGIKKWVNGSDEFKWTVKLIGKGGHMRISVYRNGDGVYRMGHVFEAEE